MNHMMNNRWTKLSRHARLYLIGACILIAGLIGAAAICATASDGNDGAIGYESVDGTIYPIMPGDSKRYQYQLERVGGKTAVLAAELDDWFTGLWQGKQLGYTFAFLSTGIALLFFMFARLISLQQQDADTGNDVTDDEER